MTAFNRRRIPILRSTAAVALAAGALSLGRPTGLPARAARIRHDIPVSVTVLAFVRPEGRTLHLLVRAPLESMRDIEFPLRGPGYLDLEAAHPLLRQAATQWIADYLDVYEGSVELGAPRIAAVRVSLPSDRSFTDYDAALAHVSGTPLPGETELPWQQAMLDVAFEYAITSDQSKFSVRPSLAHLGLRTLTVLRFKPPTGGERVFQYYGNPGLVRLDPRWYQAFLRFVRLGFLHILDGIDHLLFVLCLVIPFRRFRPLLGIVTSFTVAHSITLIASTAGFAPSALWFPPLIETLIALSIVWMALENIVGPKLERRWIVAFGFGLVHGFGFSFILRESLQFAGAHLATSLVAFNIGVELGQIFVLLLAIPMLVFLFRRVVAERMGTILLSALIAHTAWHWMTDRAASLAQYDFQLPALDAAFLAATMRALMLLLVAGGAAWALRGLVGRINRPTPDLVTTDSDV
jgi:HupE / UreJ protein